MYDEETSLWTQDRDRAKIPMEAATMFDLREKPGSEYVVYARTNQHNFCDQDEC